MGFTRKEIELMHKNLEELKDMESFIENQEDNEKGRWLMLNSPNKEYRFLNGDIRDEFVVFVKQQIESLKMKLHLD